MQSHQLRVTVHSPLLVYPWVPCQTAVCYPVPELPCLLNAVALDGMTIASERERDVYGYWLHKIGPKENRISDFKNFPLRIF